MSLVFTKEECLKWIQNEQINPRTGSKLKVGGPFSIFKKLEKQCDKYKKKNKKQSLESDDQISMDSNKSSKKSSEKSNEKSNSTNEIVRYYPDHNKDDFNLKLSELTEFGIYKEKGYSDVLNLKDFNKKMIASCPIDVFNKAYFQYFVAQYMSNKTPYKSLMLYYTVGTGKTCAAVSIAESILTGHNNNDEPPIIVILPRTLINNFKDTIYNLFKNNINGCTEDIYKYLTDSTDNKNKLNSLINKRYNIMSYGSFIKYSDKNKIISNKTIIIDEVHNLRNPGELALNNKKQNEEDDDKDDNDDRIKKIYEIIKESIKNGKNNKLILMSGTPMYNESTEIIDLFNLLLINDKKPEIKNYSDDIIKQISKSYVSYINSKNPFIYPIRLRHKDASVGSETPDGLIHVKLGKKQYLRFSNKGNENILKFLALNNICYNEKDNTAKEIFIKSDKSFSYINKKEYILDNNNIIEYSPKIAKICEYIKKSKGIIIIYSQFIEHGIFPLAIALEHMGYSRFVETGNKNYNILNEKIIRKKELNYAVITSSSSDYFSDVGSDLNIQNILRLSNSNENIHGEKLKIIIITRKASEGLSFLNIREVHILDPWYHFNRHEQIIGRGFRRCSHINLPINLRNITIFVYCGYFEKENCISADMHAYTIAKEKLERVKNVIKIIEENAFDNIINEKLNIFPKNLFKNINPLEIESSQSEKLKIYLGDDNNYKEGITLNTNDINISEENMILVKRYTIMIKNIMQDKNYISYDELSKLFNISNSRYLDLAINKVIYPNKIDNYILYWNNNGIHKNFDSNSYKQSEIILPDNLTTKLIIKNNIFKKPLDKFESSFSDFELLYRFLLYVNSDNWINIAKFIFNNHTDYPKIYNILHLNHIFFKDKYFFDLFNTNLPLLDLEGDYINKSQFNFIDHKIEKNELYGTLCIDNKSKNKLLKNIVFKIIRNKNSGTKCETLTSDNLNKIQDSNKHYKDKIHRCIDIAKKLKDANKLLIIPYIKND